MRPPAIAVLPLLVALAGCPAVAGPGTPPETVTPVPVPTTAAQHPPGVTDSGVSARELADAHERALGRTNYTLVASHRIVGSNRTVQRLDERWRVLAGGGTYAGRYNRSVGSFPFHYPIRTTEYWTDGEGFAVRQGEGERGPSVAWSDTGEPFVDVDKSRWLNRTMDALVLEVPPPTNGTVTLTVVGVHAPGRLPTLMSARDPHNVSGTIRVRTDGLVTDWRIAYDATVGERPVRVIQEGHVRKIGTTTVERPDWAENARNGSAS